MTSLVVSPSGDMLYAGVGSDVYAFSLSLSSSESKAAVGAETPFVVYTNGEEGSQGDVQVQTFILSKCGSYLYGGYNDKTVVCWNTSDGQVAGKSSVLKKKLNSMAMTSFDGKDVLLVSDKFGEVWAFDQKLEKSVMITGHSTSIITDMAVLNSASEGKDFLITSDRDEKIRISSLPDAHIIRSYCLGHTSVVSSMDIASIGDKQYIISCGWDHKLCIWDAMNNASLVLEHQLPNKTEAMETEEKEKEKEKESAPKTEDGGEEEEEEEEKNYDENKAGSYPIKVVPFTVDGANYIVILFRGENALHIYSIKSAAGFALEKVSSYDLSATPSDIVPLAVPGTKTTCLAVLLPRPHCLEFIELRLSAGGAVDCVLSEHATLVEKAGQFKEQCSQLPETVDFKQKGAASASEESGNAQFKKHNLHAPYTGMGGNERLQKGEGTRAKKRKERKLNVQVDA